MMPDFRIDDTAPEHRKLRAAGLAAVGLWSMAGAYCMRPDVLSDGWVPMHFVTSWPAGKRHASTLVKVQLWIPEKRDGIDGYQFHDWLGYQRSRSKVEEEREAARERMARNRSKEVRTNTERTFVGTSTKGATELLQSRTSSNTREKVQDGHAESPVDNSGAPASSSSDDQMFARTPGELSEKFNDSLSLSLSQSPMGDLGGEGYVGQRASSRNPNPQRPFDHCDKHPGGTSEPCGACADARRTAQAWDTRAEQRKAAVAAELEAARADPLFRCEHGTDGGRHLHPVTGWPLCALCRAAAQQEAARTHPAEDPS